MNYKPILYLSISLIIGLLAWLWLVGFKVDSKKSKRYSYGLSPMSIYYQTSYSEPWGMSILTQIFDRKSFIANAFTFEVLSEYYARDHQRAYWLDHEIEGADAKSFRPIGLSSNWSRDDNHFYYQTQALPGDLDWDKMVDKSSAFLFDKKYIIKFLNNSIEQVITHAGNVEMIDPCVLIDDEEVYYGDGYRVGLNRYKLESRSDFALYETKSSIPALEAFRIGKKVYINGKEVENMDADSYEHVNYQYSKDKNYVFYGDSILPNADPKTFENFLALYYRDRQRVYYYDGTVVEGADPATFIQVDELVAKDKNCVYYDNKPDDRPDAASFRLASEEYYYIDNTGTWMIDYENRKLERKNPWVE